MIAPAVRRARRTPWFAPWSVNSQSVYGSAAMSAETFRGFRNRHSEREALDGLLKDARNGRSAVLVVRGEPGVGKSALLRDIADRSTGFRVAQIAGVESEMELPFAGLHQLCAPMLGELDGLPEPQQRALRVAEVGSPFSSPHRGEGGAQRRMRGNRGLPRGLGSRHDSPSPDPRGSTSPR